MGNQAHPRETSSRHGPTGALETSWGTREEVDDCQEIGLKVKLASSSLSVRDLRAHHHLSMDSYFPTMSTPCKGFLDVLVCIQRAAVEIVVLANGLDHIIPPHAPPWHLLSSAPIADCSSSLSKPFIILHPSSPVQQRPSLLPISNKPLHALSCSAPHLGEAASEHLRSHRIALLAALLCHETSAEAFTAELPGAAVPPASSAAVRPPAACPACAQLLSPHSCLHPTELPPSAWAPCPYSTQQNMVLTQWREPKNEPSHAWACDSRVGVLLHWRC